MRRPALRIGIACVLSASMLVACAPSPSKARAELSSPDPAKRSAAAIALQKAYAKDAGALGDHGEAYWKAKLDQAVGMNASDAQSLLGHPTPMGGEGGGGGASDHYRLDDFWTTTLHRDMRKDTIFGHDPPRRSVVQIDVRPPAGFTGAWSTYFVSGAVATTTELEAGVLRRVRAFHDNGQLQYERLYVDGKIDGTVVTRDAKGNPEWEDTYAMGKQVGVQRWLYPNGKPRQEAHYRDGALDGRMTNYSEFGAVTFCAEYRAGVQLDGGCDAQ